MIYIHVVNKFKEGGEITRFFEFEPSVYSVSMLQILFVDVFGVVFISSYAITTVFASNQRE